MTKAIAKTLTWLLCGGAFVAVVAASGCSSSHPVGHTYSSEAAQKDAKSQAAIQTDPVDAAPPVVNVFGEFDGAGPHKMKQTSEAGFQQHTFLDEGFDSDVSV